MSNLESPMYDRLLASDPMLKLRPGRGGIAAVMGRIRLLASDPMLRLRLLRWLVSAAVLTAGTMVVHAGTAHACSCIVRELPEYADGVSVAFAGHQLERVVQDYVEDNGAGLLFRVDRVYKGEAGPLIEVRTHAQDSACGIDAGDQGSVGVVASPVAR